MEKIKIPQAILCEGRYDATRIRALFDTLVVEARGFRIFKDKEKLTLLRRLARERGLILLSDPDGAGQVIRNFLRGAIGDPNAKVYHAYVPPVAGKERRKAHPSAEGLLGVEGASDEAILQAIARSGAPTDEKPAGPAGPAITRLDLYEDGFSGGPNSASRRQALLRISGLPSHLGAKAMLEALNLFYSREDYRALVEKLDKSEKSE